MQPDPPEGYRPTDPALLRFLVPLLPPYCRDEIIGSLLEQYDDWLKTSGRAIAMQRLRREIVSVLLALPSYWYHQYWLDHGPPHWQLVRAGRVGLKRAGVWYLAGEAMRATGKPAQTVRLIVYDPYQDAFLGTLTREVRARRMPPQMVLRLGRNGIEPWRVSDNAAQVLAAMTDEPAEYWSAQRPKAITDTYQRGRGGFECRILALTLTHEWSDRRLRPTIKGPSVFFGAEEFVAAVADDEVYAREAHAYRARQQRAKA